MDELMIKVDNVSKQYKLGQFGGTTLREELQRKTAKLLKKEDPTKKIGEKDYEFGDIFLSLVNRTPSTEVYAGFPSSTLIAGSL